MKALIYAYLESEECGSDLISEYDIDESTAERIKNITSDAELEKEAQKFIDYINKTDNTDYFLDDCYVDGNMVITVY